MSDDAALQRFLAACTADDAVAALRPDYRVGLLAVEGLVAGPGDGPSEEMLRLAECVAIAGMSHGAAEDLHAGTRSAFFVLDALAPCSDDALAAAVADLADRLAVLGPDVRVAQRTISVGAPDGSRA